MKLRHLTKKERSKRSERELAKQFGGKVQPASGALPVASFKGDVVAGNILFDDKNTVRRSFSVSLAVLEKLRKQAFQCGHRVPVLTVKFDGGPRFYVLDEASFLKVREHLEKK